jgi:hypothetical protein
MTNQNTTNIDRENAFEMTPERKPGAKPALKIARFSIRRPGIFLLLVSALVGGAIIRSDLTTRTDSFTFDEAYHIGAAASYVKTGDYRLNPEHPPLVKLWVGAFVAAGGFTLTPFRNFHDKSDERQFAERDVYFSNDPDLVQARARTAMFVLNGMLMILFALAARRVFGEIIALAATVHLVIDPTTAAHLPVVMTDLPVALLSAASVIFSVNAFRYWHRIDLLFAAVTLGATLGAKHSGIVTLTAVAIIGFAMAVFVNREAKFPVRLWRLAGVGVVLIGAITVLWSFYLFRFCESPATESEQFNRPLEAKINDVKSPLYRTGLVLLSSGRLVPRAYLWGLADTIRAGAEGRAIPVFAFGSLYFNRAPFYYFPAVIGLKLPLGLLVLTILGAIFLLFRRFPDEWFAPLGGLIIFAALFLLVMVSGSSYAGIRHALPVIPVLAILGAVAVSRAVAQHSTALRSVVALAFLGALISGLIVRHPWEYYNEIIGTENAYRYFDDEGLDLGLRTKDIAGYYRQNLEPDGEIPYLVYLSPKVEWDRRGLDWVGNDSQRDAERLFGERLSGTFIIGASALAPKLFWDFGKHFREVRPVARLGNVFVFRGTFPASAAAQSYALYMRAVRTKIYTAKPDAEGAIQMLERSARLDPQAFFVALELGNQYLKIHDRSQALRAYRTAAENAPRSDSIHGLLVRQIERLESDPVEKIQPLRNPAIE